VDWNLRLCLTCYSALSVSDVIKISLPSRVFLLAVFLKALFLVLYFWSCVAPTQYSYLLTFLNRHLYADDTQLFNFDSYIAHLQTSLQHVFFWISASLLALNSSKTEYFITGLTKAIFKNIQFITQYYSARNLSFIFDEHPTFSYILPTFFFGLDPDLLGMTFVRFFYNFCSF